MIEASDIDSSPQYGGCVKRYHTWPTITTQTVADHSWHVYRIWLEIFGLPTAAVAYHIWAHDVTEVKTGDPPFPVKALNGRLRDEYTRLEEEAWEEMGLPAVGISEEDMAKIKCCDLLEMAEFAVREIIMGNHHALPVLERTLVAAARKAESWSWEDKIVYRISSIKRRFEE